MLMSAGTTLVCELIAYLLQIIIFNLQIEVLAFIKIALIEDLYNVMLIIIIYPLIVRMGTLLEKVFIEKNIFTKYY